jgi:hypothetical protein
MTMPEVGASFRGAWAYRKPREGCCRAEGDLDTAEECGVAAVRVFCAAVASRDGVCQSGNLDLVYIKA